MPALATRMSTWPMAASAAGTSASTSAPWTDCRAARGALAELAGKRLEHFAARARDGDRRALRVQRLRDRAANAAGRAGDERRLASQIEHRYLLHAELRGRQRILCRGRSPGPLDELQRRRRRWRLTSPLSTLPAPISLIA